MADKKSSKTQAGVVITGEKTKQDAELAIIEQQKSFETMLVQAIEKGTGIDVIERIMQVREKVRAEYAKAAFDDALSNFQANCPTIEKIKEGAKTQSGKVAFYYAPLDHIINTVKPLLKQTGLSYSFDAVKNDGNRVSVTCIVKHRLGHSEKTTINIPLGSGTQIMSAPQVEMATMTYAKRYAFCNAFGIMTGDEDIDGQELDDEQTKAQRPRSTSIPTGGTGGVPTGVGGVAITYGPTNGGGTHPVQCAGDCGTLIEDQAVIEFSKARYKKPLCRDCQAKQQ